MIEQCSGDPNAIGNGELLPIGHLEGHAFHTPEMAMIAWAAGNLPMTFHVGAPEQVDQLREFSYQAPNAKIIIAMQLAQLYL